MRVEKHGRNKVINMAFALLVAFSMIISYPGAIFAVDENDAQIKAEAKAVKKAQKPAEPKLSSQELSSKGKDYSITVKGNLPEGAKPKTRVLPVKIQEEKAETKEPRAEEENKYLELSADHFYISCPRAGAYGDDHSFHPRSDLRHNAIYC